MAHMKKRVLSVLMALVLAIGLLPTAALADNNQERGLALSRTVNPTVTMPKQDGSGERETLKSKWVHVKVLDDQGQTQYECDEMTGLAGRVWLLRITTEAPAKIEVTYQQDQKTYKGTADLSETSWCVYGGTVNLELVPPPLSGYTVDLDVKLIQQPVQTQGNQLQNANVNVRIFDESKNELYNQAHTTDASGHINFLFSTQANLNRVVVTYTNDNGTSYTDEQPLEGQQQTPLQRHATLNLKQAKNPNITDDDQKVIDATLGSAQFRVYRLYANIIPANINQGFDPALFGPGGNNSCYFQVTVDMAKLLAMTGMDAKYSRGWWYVSLQTCTSLGANNEARLDPFWNNVLSCMSAADQAQFQTFFGGSYRGYVLKQETAKHIDGIVKAQPPAYTTELYVGGQIIKTDTISNGNANPIVVHPYSFVTEGFEAYLATTYGAGTMDWAALRYTVTATGEVYQLVKGAWPVNGADIIYTQMGGDAGVNVARFYVSSIEKISKEYTVDYQYNYRLNGGAYTAVGTEKAQKTLRGVTEPGNQAALDSAAATKSYTTQATGEKAYNKGTNVATDVSYDAVSTTYTVKFYCDDVNQSYAINYEFWYQLDNGARQQITTNLPPVSPTVGHGFAAPTAQDVRALVEGSYPIGEKTYSLETATVAGDFLAGQLVATVKYFCHEETIPHTYKINEVYKYKLDNGAYVVAGSMNGTQTYSAQFIPGDDAVLDKVETSKTVNSAVLYNGAAIGSKTYSNPAVTSTTGEFVDDTLVYTVTYTCNDVTPQYVYFLEYEHWLSTDGNPEIQVTTIADEGRTEKLSVGVNPTAAMAFASSKGSCSHAEGIFKPAGAYAPTEVTNVGNYTSQTGTGPVYRIKLHGSNWTMGRLQINKTFEGIGPQQIPNPIFTITGGNLAAPIEVAYSRFTNGSYVCSGLLPGIYTVTETGAGVTGYDLEATSTVDIAPEAGYQVAVTAGATAQVMTITNSYESKDYTITFDAGSHGLANNVNGHYTYNWTRFMEPVVNTQTDPITYFDWAGVLNATAPGSQVIYRFTYGQYLAYQQATAEQVAMTIGAPSVTAAPGYEVKKVDGKAFFNGDVAFTTIGDAVAAMQSSGEDSITYLAGYTPSANTPYTVNFYYQLADGTYGTTADKTLTHTGTTGDLVVLPESDKVVDGALGLRGVTYAFDHASSNYLTIVGGVDGTVLSVYFNWKAGATYTYVGATDAIRTQYPLPADSGDVYALAAPVSRLGAADGTQVTDPTGTWTLRWNLPAATTMTAAGVQFVGTWSFVSAGSANVSVRFVNEDGEEIFTDAAYSKTAAFGSPYDFAAADNILELTDDGYAYYFVKDYVGEFNAAKDDENVTYAGTIPASGNLVLTRVYAAETLPVQVTKSYNISTLPAGFTVAVTDTVTGRLAGELTLANAMPNDDGDLLWMIRLPVGRTYTFTERNYENGSGWSTVLTAQKLAARTGDGEWVMQTLPVTGFAFQATITVDDMRNEVGAIEMNNRYTYQQPITPPEPDDADDGPNLPDEKVPLEELPEEEVPLAEVPEAEVPLAEVPATGDNLALWLMAAASSLGLLWMVLASKKHGEEDNL